jgi:ATP-dependent protease ClpP protease subunit
LPKIQAFEGVSGLTFEPDGDALAKWQPSIRSASEADSDAVISIYDIIGEDWMSDNGVTSKRIAAALRRIGNQPVTVNINSPGGDFFEGVAIYNLLRDHPQAVTVKVMGLAASAASVIAMAGDRIEIAEVGFLMVHNAWAVAIGNRHDMRAAADMMEPFDDAMAGLYSSRAGVQRSKAAEWMDAETWFNGQQAVSAGLADGLLAPGTVIDAGGTNAFTATRRVDALLAKNGMPRSERRALLAELKRGTRDAAAEQVTPGADLDTAAEMQRFIDIVGKKQPQNS